MRSDQPSWDARTNNASAGSGAPRVNRRGRWSLVAALAVACAAGSSVLFLRGRSADPQDEPKLPPPPVAAPAPELGDAPAARASAAGPELFAHWPKQKPEAVLVITGQTYGYLQKCGCSNPQKGGLERRYNFIESLRKRGWDVVPLDLGDVPHMTKVPQQALLKYRVAMESMKDMGYRSVGVGKEEFRFPLLAALSTYSLNNDEPRVVAVNFAEPNQQFPGAKGSMVQPFDVTPTRGGVAVGTVGVIGRSLREHGEKIDNTLQFAAKGGELVLNALAEIDQQAQRLKKKDVVKVLMFQGWSERDPAKPQQQPPMLQEAVEAARLIPDFQVVVCPSEESEAPTRPRMEPTKNGKTMIVQVGHKGQNVGVVGVFRDAAGALEFHYERVPIGPEFETPAADEKAQPILKRLEWYAREVKAENFLAQYPKMPHPLKAKAALFAREGKLPANAPVSFVGSESCRACHAAQFAVWQSSKHAQAYAALEKKASKPSMRNFDPECIVCHTVGFDYQTGFVDATRTPKLKDVGCENCHGPGSLHVSQPMNKLFYAEMSPWKGADPKAKLPEPELMKKLGDARTRDEADKMLTPAQKSVVLRVHDVCFKCHDTDNDPHFQFETFWPKIYHTASKKENQPEGPALSKP